jgi:dedicator of cytokinesis protein 3
VPRLTPDGFEEVWIEKTYYTTEAFFPTVLRRSEVLKIDVQHISPIEHALTEVETKTQELSSLYVRYSAVAKTAQVVSTNALSMTLNSAVDTPGSGGVPSFRQVFLDPEYVARYPERMEAVNKLRTAIDIHVRAFIVRGLRVLNPDLFLGSDHRALPQATWPNVPARNAVLP